MLLCVRLDDACPWYNKERWLRFESLLDGFGIKPLVGVIPKYEGHMKESNVKDDFFWERVDDWQKKGWSIALHGFNHTYRTVSGGVNPINHRSEFAGVPYEEQVDMIHKGLRVFKEHNINPIAFFAPSHTYDNNTILALLKESPIRVVSDGISLDAYQELGMLFVPLVPGRNLPFSKINTLCYHPSLIETEEEWHRIETQLRNNLQRIVPFSEVCKSNRGITILDRIVRKIYFTVKGR